MKTNQKNTETEMKVIEQYSFSYLYKFVPLIGKRPASGDHELGCQVKVRVEYILFIAIYLN